MTNFERKIGSPYKNFLILKYGKIDENPHFVSSNTKSIVKTKDRR